MIWVLALLLIAPAWAEEIEEMVTVPKAVLVKIIADYIEQKAANVLLWERQEEINKRLDRWRNGTTCS